MNIFTGADEYRQNKIVQAQARALQQIAQQRAAAQAAGTNHGAV